MFESDIYNILQKHNKQQEDLKSVIWSDYETDEQKEFVSEVKTCLQKYKKDRNDLINFALGVTQLEAPPASECSCCFEPFHTSYCDNGHICCLACIQRQYDASGSYDCFVCRRFMGKAQQALNQQNPIEQNMVDNPRHRRRMRVASRSRSRSPSRVANRSISPVSPVSRRRRTPRSPTRNRRRMQVRRSISPQRRNHSLLLEYIHQDRVRRDILQTIRDLNNTHTNQDGDNLQVLPVQMNGNNPPNFIIVENQGVQNDGVQDDDVILLDLVHREAISQRM